MESEQGIEKEAIPFLPLSDKQKTYFLEVKYTISNASFKIQLPIFCGGSAKEFLQFLYEFEQAKSKLGYTTYQKLGSGLEQLLQGTAKNEWSTIKGTVQPGTNSVNSFTARLEAFWLIYIPESAAIENNKLTFNILRKMINFLSPDSLTN